MNRREFICDAGAAIGGLTALPAFAAITNTAPRIRWTRTGGEFTAVSCDGQAMAATTKLLSAICRVTGWKMAIAPLHATVAQRLRDSGAGQGEDVFEVTLTVRNATDRPQDAEIEFATSVRPSPAIEAHHAYLPLSAAGPSGDGRFAAFGVRNFLKDCNQPVGKGNFAAHYLEPAASCPTERQTRALLLAPVIDVFDPQRPWRVSLFTSSDRPMRFSRGGDGWRAGRQLKLAAGEELTERCWLMLHTGDATAAWRAFHRFAHREDFAVPGWVRQFKVHYFDFLSSAEGEKGHRGGGYDADLPHFREFRVGMATQHGCYPAIGDYIHPDRKTWQAMRGDKHGPVEVSLDKMRERVAATRRTGAKAAIYMHAALFDDAAECFPPLKDCIQIDAAGNRMTFGWTGPDTAGKTWRASLASAEWRAHLLQQAGWIMDLLRPDAIVVDETFAGLGYDYHAGRAGATSPVPTSAAAIDFYRKLRALVHSFGDYKAVFASDCSMSPFVLWADGECGDHAYPGLLGHPLYTQAPVRYLAALGDKPWRPCAWQFRRTWTAQMKLARQTGAGVGVSNGWLEYTGLARLPADAKAGLLADIATL